MPTMIDLGDLMTALGLVHLQNKCNPPVAAPISWNSSVPRNSAWDSAFNWSRSTWATDQQRRLVDLACDPANRAFTMQQVRRNAVRTWIALMSLETCRITRLAQTICCHALYRSHKAAWCTTAPGIYVHAHQSCPACMHGKRLKVPSSADI